jgi:deoxyribodipyrimidine photo-lyase
MQSGTTGINTLRIYNPTKQALDQDPYGIFIRRWVPELAGLSPAYIHMPWAMPVDVQQAYGCIIGRDYPAPLVDHIVAVREAKRRLAMVRNAPESRAEARDVAHRHGSRKDRRGAMQQDPVRRTLFGDNADNAGRLKRRPSPPVHDPQQLLPFLTEDLAADVAGDVSPKTGEIS